MNFDEPGPGTDPIVVEGQYPVAPSRVFSAWTDPTVVKQWFGSQPGALEHAAIDLRPGGRWQFTEHTSGGIATGFEGEYLEVVQDKLLVFTWAKVTENQQTGYRRSTSYSKVEIRFAADGDGTAMRIVHSDLDTENRKRFKIGWATGSANLAHLLTNPARGSAI